MEVEFVDRYSAIGTPYPCPWTMCKGGCAGMGVYPVRYEEWRNLGRDTGGVPTICPQRAEDGDWETIPDADGYLFVYCEKCSGSGRRVTGRLAYCLELLYTYWYQIWWPLWTLSTNFVSEGIWGRVRYLPFYFRFIHRDQRQQRRLIRGRAS